MVPQSQCLNSLSSYCFVKPILINNYLNIGKIPPSRLIHSTPKIFLHEISKTNSKLSDNKSRKPVKNLVITYLNFSHF